MILTPDEAKTKVCPFMSGRGDDGAPATRCLADDCMAWRWAPLRSPKEHEERNQWMGGQASVPAGYCGA